MTLATTYFHNVLLDDLRIVAHRLDEEELEAHLVDDDVAYELTSLHGGVRGVENGDFTVAALQPLADVIQGIHCTLCAYRHGFYIVRTEELVALISCGGVSPVFTQVEDFGAYADPVEISTQFLGYVSFAASWQSDHCNHMRLVYEIRAFTYNRKRVSMTERSPAIEEVRRERESEFCAENLKISSWKIENSFLRSLFLRVNLISLMKKFSDVFLDVWRLR